MRDRELPTEAPFYVGVFMIGYKLFRLKRAAPGMLFPLYVLSEDPVPMGVWLPAREGPRGENGKVKSRIGDLAFRPGWHLSDIPLAIHIGIREEGKIKYMHDDEVWCECEFSDGVDYQPEADARGTRDGVLHPKEAMLTEIPVDGYYRYKTSPQMLGKWIIAGSIKVNRILSDAEVERICRAAGYTPLPRKHPFSAAQYGL